MTRSGRGDQLLRTVEVLSDPSDPSSEWVEDPALQLPQQLTEHCMTSFAGGRKLLLAGGK